MIQATVESSRFIPGFILFKNEPFEDERGSFSELFRSSDMAQYSSELAQFSMKQANLSSSQKGVIRGIHGEPWHKFATIVRGKVFIAIVDLRPGSNYGAVHTEVIERGWSFFIPQGCGNSFQALEDTDYFYMVSEEWSADKKYTMVNFADPTLAIQWPIAEYIVSDKDRAHPNLQPQA